MMWLHRGTTSVEASEDGVNYPGGKVARDGCHSQPGSAPPMEPSASRRPQVWVEDDGCNGTHRPRASTDPSEDVTMYRYRLERR